jgi:hypothetical protein
MHHNIDQVIASTHRRIRGYILRCLNLYPTEDINVLVITDFVGNCGCNCLDAEMLSHLSYLEAKGYIEIKEISDKRLGDLKATVAQITPRGIDLLEANIPEDPGILT